MQFDITAFNDSYNTLVRGNHFFEDAKYYDQQRARYRNTLSELQQAGLGNPRRVLEIGGGQILLLGKDLFGYSGLLADVNDQYASWIRQHGIDFTISDLVHDDLQNRDEFDLVVLCEVIEHIPIPHHIVLEKIYRWLKPGGTLFITTPNLYRLRNLIRMAINGPLFCPLFYPERGFFLGHPCEFSEANLRWQMQKAGFEDVTISYRQLANHGSTLKAHLQRLAAAPLLWTRPIWRDNLVAFGNKPIL